MNNGLTTLSRIAPNMIKKNRSSRLSDWKKMQQAIQQGGKEIMEKVIQKIIKKGIEEVYKTPLRLLG